jgi:SWIM/SEC-C metal-binding protein
MPRVSGEPEGKIFDGRRGAKLGTEKNPAQLSVTGAKREAEIKAVCDERGWACLITVDPEQPENIADFERLLNPPQPVFSDNKPGRNDACPCGSGKKYKKCCVP